MSPLPPAAAERAAALLRRFDGRDDEAVVAMEELRDLLSRYGLGFSYLAERVAWPIWHIAYVNRPRVGHSGINWPDDLRVKALELLEKYGGWFTRSLTDQRRLDEILMVLRDRRGRFTRAQADHAERLMRLSREVRT